MDKKYLKIVFLGEIAGEDEAHEIFEKVKKMKTSEEIKKTLKNINAEGTAFLKEFKTEAEREAYEEGLEDAFGYVSNKSTGNIDLE